MKTGAEVMKVNISAYFLLRLSTAKLVNVYQTYVPGTVVSALVIKSHLASRTGSR